MEVKNMKQTLQIIFSILLTTIIFGCASTRINPIDEGINPSDQPLLQEHESTQKQKTYQNITSAINEQATKGVIEVIGDVVDEEGKPISQVTMSVVGMRSNFIQFESDKVFDETQIIYGHFTARISECNLAKLHFTKKGYYDEEIQCALPTDFIDISNGKADKDKIKLEIKLTNQLVVLIKKKNINLKAMSGDINYILNVPEWKKYFLQNNRRPSPAKGCFYIVAKRHDKDLVQMKIWTDPNNQCHRVASDVRVILNPSEPGDGIIEVTGAKNFLYMNEAPAEGYQHLEIAYDPAKDDFRIPCGLENARYFYFKVGGVYGKGRVIFDGHGECASIQLLCPKSSNSGNPRNLQSSER